MTRAMERPADQESNARQKEMPRIGFPSARRKKTHVRISIHAPVIHISGGVLPFSSIQMTKKEV